MNRGFCISIICLLGLCMLFGCNGVSETNGEIKNVAEDAMGEQIFSVSSTDGSSTIQVSALKDNYEYRIKEVTVIVDGMTLNSIYNIVGYYDDLFIDNQTSLALIKYHGRKWSNFVLLDIKSGLIVYDEPFYFSDLKSAYHILYQIINLLTCSKTRLNQRDNNKSRADLATCVWREL